jgi:16S rRNA (guanine966-N2)-methyltransferase
MRIIAGTARGRTLVTPKGRSTRPTQDYVRESLFNIIQRDVPEAVVLDLFAGSGALALESISRGAAKAALADCSRQAIECIRRNAETLGFSDRTTILHGDWRAAADRLSAAGFRFDLVFLDPPYDLTQYAEITEALHNRALLAQEALIIVEHQKDVALDLSPSFILRDMRTYGDTVIHLFTFDTGGNSDGT